MASNKRQFMIMYQQAIELLKSFKQNNDMINKNIGIEQDRIILSKIKSQETTYNKLIQKLQQTLLKLQKSYLDPDTARKIGTLKQQFKIQKDRRESLLQSLKQGQKQTLNHHHKNSISTSQQYINNTLNTISQNKNKQNYLNKKDDETLSHRTTNYTTKEELLYKQQLVEYDYEIECKMLTEKNKAIEEAEKTFLNIYNITKQTQNMVYQQGEELDIITDELIRTNKNTVFTAKELKEANENQKKSRMKYVKFSIFMILAVIVVLTICMI